MKHPAIEKLEKQALLDRIAELEEQAEGEQEFPQDGDECWYILSGGGVDWIQWGESGFGLQIGRAHV